MGDAAPRSTRSSSTSPSATPPSSAKPAASGKPPASTKPSSTKSSAPPPTPTTTSDGDGFIDVLLVDPLPVVRAGVKAALAGERDVRVVGECGGAAEGLRLAVALRPRVVIMDLLSDAEPAAAAAGSGFGLIKDLRVQAPATRALVCSAALAAPMISHLLAIGARGYLRKDAPLAGLAQAVRAVAAGRVYVAPDAAEALIAGLAHPPPRRHRRRAKRGRAGTRGAGDAIHRTALLSGCEMEVLHLIGSGQTTRAIASVLHRSIKTIQTYRSRIVRKLGVNGPSAMAQLAWRFVHAVGATAA